MSSLASLTTLPVEVLVDHLLPFIPLADLAHLGATNHFFNALYNDDILWKRKLIGDFNYPRVLDARTSGYKTLYKGMKQPKVYAWGSIDNGRLGLSSKELNDNVVRAFGGVPQPVELGFFGRKGVQIVQLSAGGWSFHALDSAGTLWVWGQLNDNYAFQGDPFSHPGRRAVVPHRIAFPDNLKFQSISAGRNHASALDSRSNVWTMRSWGRPYRVVSPHLSGVVQLCCGWSFSAALTAEGEVYVWWPGSGEFSRLSDEYDAAHAPSRQSGRQQEGVIETEAWEMQANPLELPGLGGIEDTRGQAATERLKIVQIACGTDFVVALTNANQVLKIDLEGGDAADGFDMLRQSFRTGRRWQYLPLFSEAKRVAMLPAFQSGSTPVPEDMRITHVSAQFNTFVAYSTGSSSIVLMGSNSTQDDISPTVIPALQHRNVISVTLGDYHRAALTAQGELLTWGAFSQGALGLGDPYKLEPGSPGGFLTINDRDRAQRARRTPPDVEEPTPVNFHLGQEGASPTFCFGAAAAGWHVGALVLDLEEQKHEPPRVTVGSSSNGEGAEPPLEHDPEDPSMPGSFTRSGAPAGSRVRGVPPYAGARVGQHTVDGRFEPQEPDLTRAMALYPGVRLGYAARGALRGSHPRGN